MQTAAKQVRSLIAKSSGKTSFSALVFERKLFDGVSLPARFFATQIPNGRLQSWERASLFALRVVGSTET